MAVWDFSTRETLLEIVDVNEQLIASSVWAPDGKRLAILRDSGAIDILDSTNGDLLVKLPGNSTCRCIAFSENGQTLIAGADTLVCWNAQNGQQIAEYDTAGQVNSLAAAGDFCAYATETGKVTVRNVTTGELVEVFASSPGEASWLEFSSDAKHLICVGIDGKVYVWDLEQIALAKQIDLSVEDLTAVVTHFASGRIFTGTEDGVLKIWDLESGEFLIEIARTWVPIISLDINADGTKLLSAEEYQGVTTWDVNAVAPPNLNVQR